MTKNKIKIRKDNKMAAKKDKGEDNGLSNKDEE